jgi:hypothetical protein
VTLPETGSTTIRTAHDPCAFVSKVIDAFRPEDLILHAAQLARFVRRTYDGRTCRDQQTSQGGARAARSRFMRAGLGANQLC